jgi:hypothetical protein
MDIVTVNQQVVVFTLNLNLRRRTMGRVAGQTVHQVLAIPGSMLTTKLGQDTTWSSHSVRKRLNPGIVINLETDQARNIGRLSEVNSAVQRM